MMRSALIAVLMIVLFPVLAVAQTATLLADRVEITGDAVIIATGDVEVLYGDTRLRASRIIYDSKAETMRIEGPIVLLEGDTTIVLASSAELDPEMQNGVMHSARVVLDQQLQLAAQEIRRVDGRYTQLYKTVASSCQTCAKNPIPLWQIRAKKIVHDQQEHQLYFHQAQFRVLGVPIAYIPRLRLPDPSVDRATGFLVPSLRNSSRLGNGIKVPYFITLGDHADLTLTPYVSAKTRTIEARYRQIFRRGNIELNMAATSDQLHKDGMRSYLFASGRFNLPRDYRLGFNIRTTSDPAYLLEYGYSGADRLNSNITVNRTDHDEQIDAELLHIRTLRGSELSIEDQLPSRLGHLVWQRRFYPGFLGGQGSWQLDMQGHRRDSTADMLGRDVLRVGGKLDWGRDWQFANGMLGRVGAEFSGDFYHITHDSDYDSSLFHHTPALEAELRWPFIRASTNGAYDLIEPVIHLAWSETYGPDVPNEDSTLVEFDEGNLFSLSRFPGSDRHEAGGRAAVGFNWTRYHPKGWSSQLSFGRVFHLDQNPFSVASGLSKKNSNWLAAIQIKYDNRLSITSRLLWDDDFDLTKAESRLDWDYGRLSLASGYTWIIADIEENRTNLTSQIVLSADYDLSRHWNGKLNWRYDSESDRSTRTALELTYRNECVRVDLSLSRRFTSSTSVSPATSYGVAVSLNGFGNNNGRAYKRQCRG